MRSLLLSSTLAVSISCTAYAKPSGNPIRPPKAAPCVTVADISNKLHTVFQLLPQALYDVVIAKTEGTPVGVKSMVASPAEGGMIVAPLDAKGCVLGTHLFNKDELNFIFGKSAPPAAAKPPAGEDQADSDHV